LRQHQDGDYRRSPNGRQHAELADDVLV